jgi:hypothetical protein
VDVIAEEYTIDGLLEALKLMEMDVK